jgi:hypothetical protein
VFHELPPTVTSPTEQALSGELKLALWQKGSLSCFTPRLTKQSQSCCHAVHKQENVMLKQKSLAALTFICLASSAWAQSTQPEADRIKAALEKYLGKTPGVLTVQPKGDAYELTLDSSPLLKRVPNITAEISKFIYSLKPMSDKKWEVSSDGPLSAKLKLPDGQSNSYTAERMVSKGIFDEVNQVTLNSDFEVTNFTNSSEQSDATTGMSSKFNMKLASIKGTTKGTVVSPGVVDIQQQMTTSGVSQDISLSGLAAANIPPTQLTITSTKDTYAIDFKGARTTGLFQLIAWFIAHPEQKLIVADQQGMKDAIRSALPLWDKLDSTTSLEGVKVLSSIGTFDVQKLIMNSNMSGLGKNANIQLVSDLQGLGLPQGLLPTWANELAPTVFKLDFAISGWDAESGIAFVVDKIDLKKEPPLSNEDWAVAVTKFAPNPIKITINPSQLGSGISTISYSGEFKYLGEKGSGEMTVTQTGFDALFEKVQAAAATDPLAQQLATGLIGAKGLGKADGKGGYTWVISVSEDGKALVNGIDVTKLSASP